MKQRGFTLVEVLVAMLIMAMLAVMAWQGVDGITRTRDVSQARLEQTLRLNTVMGQFEQDLQALQDDHGRTVALHQRALLEDDITEPQAPAHMLAPQVIAT